MKSLSELTADQCVELALLTLIEHGWKKNEYYSSWKEYAGEEFEEFDEDGYSVTDSSGAWGSLVSGYVETTVTKDGLTAKLEADQGDGVAHDSEVYFVVLSLTDSSGNTRYFKREGWYASYDGGHLEEGTNSEVYPKQVTLTVFEGK